MERETRFEEEGEEIREETVGRWENSGGGEEGTGKSGKGGRAGRTCRVGIAWSREEGETGDVGGAGRVGGIEIAVWQRRENDERG
jgi:hypothetical protein